jgi:peroxiredoxin Q/BCP
MIKIGDRAPDFNLPSGNGRMVSLKELKGKKVILYFYPKDNTSGCTAEACSFQDGLTFLKKKGAIVIGISADSPSSHSKFADKYGLHFPLLSDGKKEVIKKYDVWKEKSMYGKKYYGIERTTFVIDENGIIQSIFRKVKVGGHVDEVLEVI